MKSLKVLIVDFNPLEHAMRDLCRESNDFYLNRISGKVIGLSRSLIRSLVEENNDSQPALADWDAPMIPLARQIIIKGSAEFVRIPEAFGCPEHAWMSDFIEKELRGPKLKQKLQATLRGRGSCKRFKEILKEQPDDFRRWSAYRTRCWKEKIQAWLETIGILAVSDTHPKPSTSRS